MTDLFHSMTFDDDLLTVCDAFSDWCLRYGINPECPEGRLAASKFIDLFQAGAMGRADVDDLNPKEAA
jgi:hypothetical protein